MNNNSQQIVSVIYFLQREDGAIKIGTTINFDRRLYTLVLEHGKLRVLGLISGSYEKERELHQNFSPFRIKNEWFQACQELLDFINQNANRTIQSPWIGVEHFRQETRKPRAKKKREFLNNIPSMLAKKEIRDKCRYKQNAIAQALGLSDSMVSRILSDKFDIEQMTYGNACKWASWLGCKVDDLVIDLEN